MVLRIPFLQYFKEWPANLWPVRNKPRAYIPCGARTTMTRQKTDMNRLNRSVTMSKTDQAKARRRIKVNSDPHEVVEDNTYNWAHEHRFSY